MKKKHVYRVGDKIRILEYKPVIRVGYPMSLHDYAPMIPDYRVDAALKLLYDLDTPIEKLLEDHIKHELDGKPKEVFDKWILKQKEWDDNPKLRYEAAFMLAKNDNFGGNERSIHYETSLTTPYYDKYPTITKVLSKRVVKTGFRVPPSSSYDSYYGEYEYVSGGLENQQTHVLLRTPLGEFNSIHVEPVKETK